MSNEKTSVLHVFMNHKYSSIVYGKGIYLYDDQGNRFIDAAGGPILCNLGHGIEEMADALYEQAKKAAMVYRFHFTTPILEKAAIEVCGVTGGIMDKVFFVSGGSEATEIAVKLARKYHLDKGQPSRFKIISRWLSYHGMTAGALSWSGMTARRADYVPYLKDFSHIPPAYCYRCWFDQRPETCDLACAQALENEIMCQGPDTVAAFMAEPVSGMSLCGAAPRADYFKRIREICDKWGLLLILDEIMTGFGRTGRWFGYEQFDIAPDILALGKGMGGGYFPIGAAAVSSKVYKTIAGNSGIFGSGFSWAGNPMAAAVTAKTIDYLKSHHLVERCAEMGAYFRRQLEELRGHPTVGDIRGKGLMIGIEFVRDKESKEPLDPAAAFWMQLSSEALKRGLFIETSAGCDRGQAGDQMMFGPPFIITREEIDEIVHIFDETLTTVEKKFGF